VPKVVDIPNYGAVEFPDSMSDADVSTAIKTQIMRSPDYVAKVKDPIGKQYGQLADSQQEPGFSENLWNSARMLSAV
jgi:hypothetical protein